MVVIFLSFYVLVLAGFWVLDLMFLRSGFIFGFSPLISSSTTYPVPPSEYLYPLYPISRYFSTSLCSRANCRIIHLGRLRMKILVVLDRI